MTRVLIVEDEQQMSAYLAALVQKNDSKSTISGIVDSVDSAVNWLLSHPAPDLIFMDVQLGDGLCFEIFEKVDVPCPIVFTTAYDEYALRAFKLNSIDYLLKPVKPDALRFSLNKFYQLTKASASDTVRLLQEIINTKLESRQEVQPKSFLVSFRDKLIPVRMTDIAWLAIHKGVVVATLRDDRNLVIEKTLEEMESHLDTHQFFRANRQFIIARECIREVELYFNGRLLVRTDPASSNQILISKERVPVFKKWFEA